MFNNFISKNNNKTKLKSLDESGAGFTLIESLIYIALFTIVIGGGMVAVYNIIEATNANTNHVILQEEANFLFRKIDWALTGATSITIPSAGSLTSNKLEVVKNSTSIAIETNLTNLNCPINYLCLKRDPFSPVQLNSSSLYISGLLFTRTLAANGKPDSIKTNFSLITVQNGRATGQDFTFTKYLRK